MGEAKMRNAIVAIAALVILALCTGCSMTGGKVVHKLPAHTHDCGEISVVDDEAPGSFTGLHIQLGDTTGPAGIKGGKLSEMGSGVIGGVFEGLVKAGMAYFGESEPAPTILNFDGMQLIATPAEDPPPSK